MLGNHNLLSFIFIEDNDFSVGPIESALCHVRLRKLLRSCVGPVVEFHHEGSSRLLVLKTPSSSIQINCLAFTAYRLCLTNITISEVTNKGLTMSRCDFPRQPRVWAGDLQAEDSNHG